MNLNKILVGFGGRFKVILDKHNLTQAEFADSVEMNRGLVSRYIRGEKPSGDFLLKAVAKFPNDISFLFFGIENNSIGEPKEKYDLPPEMIISKIESELNDLKRILSQK